MSGRISFTLIGIQGLKRKFALWKALCWLLVWWFPLSFKVLESGCFLRHERGCGWMQFVGWSTAILLSLQTIWDFMSYIKHWAGGTFLCRSQGRTQIPEFFKWEFCILSRVDSGTSLFVAVPELPSYVWFMEPVETGATGLCQGFSV